MSKVQDQISELVNKWAAAKVVYPVGWSDEKFLASKNISYKTYKADDGLNAHKVVALTIDDVKYELTFWSHKEIEVKHPLEAKANTSKILEALEAIYTELTSIEGIIEGKEAVRKAIAEKKREIKSKKRDLERLEEQFGE